MEKWHDLKTQQNLTPNVALLQLLVLDQDRSAELGKTLLQAAPTTAEFQRRLSLIETILANKFPDLTKEIIMQILDLKQMDITQSRFYQEIRAEALQEGHQEEAANLVLRLLNRRFGTLSSEQSDRVNSLSVSHLEELAEALLDFTALTDLEVWLAERSLLPNNLDRL